MAHRLLILGNNSQAEGFTLILSPLTCTNSSFNSFGLEFSVHFITRHKHEEQQQHTCQGFT